MPEKILHYKENAKSQTKILLPTSIKVNINGDIFVLDKGAACIHAYNRADVVKEYTIGKYNTPSNKVYPTDAKEQLCVKHLTFTDSLQAIEIHLGNLVVADKSKVFIIRNCTQVDSLSTKRVFIVKIEGCIGLAKIEMTQLTSRVSSIDYIHYL